VFHAVEDYPQNLLELEARFSTEEACRAYLSRYRFFEINVMSGVRLARHYFAGMLKKNWGAFFSCRASRQYNSA